MKTIPFEFMSWFCGCGCGTLGMLRAGGKGLLAVDGSRVALDSHRENLPGVPTIQLDLNKAKTEDFARLMRAAGVRDPRTWRGVHLWTSPCQGFSTAGKGDPDDPRNELLLLVGELATASPKSLIIIEQVKGMLLDKNRKIVDRLRDLVWSARRQRLPEDLTPYLYNAWQFGLAQRRRRVLLPIPAVSEPMPGPISGLAIDADDETKARTLRDEIFGMRLEPGDCRFLTPEERKVQQYIRPGRSLKDALKEGRLPPEVARLCKTWVNKLSRAAWDRPSNAVCSVQPRMVRRVALVHPDEPRNLSVAECSKLQGFPADWRLAGDLWERYEQVGNAVPPPLIEAAARAYYRPLLARRA